MPTWFLALNGAALLLMGGLMLSGRLRDGVSFASPGKFFGVVWSLLCCLVGAGLLLMANGRLPRPGEPRVAPPHRAVQFPVDR